MSKLTVICDETNNSEQDRAENKLNVELKFTNVNNKPVDQWYCNGHPAFPHMFEGESRQCVDCKETIPEPCEGCGNEPMIGMQCPLCGDPNAVEITVIDPPANHHRCYHCLQFKECKHLDMDSNYHLCDTCHDRRLAKLF